MSQDNQVVVNKRSIADRDFEYSSFYTILQLQCAKCDDQACLDTANVFGSLVAEWEDMITTAKQKGWYVSKKHGIALCPICRKEEDV